MKTMLPAFALALLAAPVLAEGDAPIALDMPIRCQPGKTCFIQQYFDHDPSPGARDYKCGTESYQGHDGTDIRIPTLAAQQRGVEVLAAAPGTVRGVRDGMADADVRIAGPQSVKDKECGNGAAISHDGGWETQYCHMAKGSLRVRPGQQVQRGTALGLVGESGDAAFPHLHLSVRRNGVKIDPFASDPGRCGAGTSLWTPAAAAALAYHSPDVINAGFAPALVTMDDVESGRAETLATGAGSPALVAYVRAIGLDVGDVLSLSLLAPDKSVMVAKDNPPLESAKAQWLSLLGKKRGAARWPAGNYVARYQVTRRGSTVLSRQFTLAIP